MVAKRALLVFPASSYRPDAYVRAAQELGVDFLGEVPIDPRVAEDGDVGQPIVVSQPDSPSSAALRTIAGEVARKVAMLAVESPPIAIQLADFLAGLMPTATRVAIPAASHLMHEENAPVVNETIAAFLAGPRRARRGRRSRSPGSSTTCPRGGSS